MSATTEEEEKKNSEKRRGIDQKETEGGNCVVPPWRKRGPLAHLLSLEDSLAE